MKTKLLTDMELRAKWSRSPTDVYYVEEGTLLTPAARDFLREHRVELRYAPVPDGSMTRTPVPVRSGKPVYRIAATGRELDHKPEEMTHLRGALLVPKFHPQIAFRGRLDTLMAQIIETQLLADECGEPCIVEDLEELLAFSRQILAAEVKDEALPALRLLGMDSRDIRHTSHQIKESYGIEHPIPHYQMGKLCVALNLLRTQVREVELAAVRAFCREDGTFDRTDIIEGLNRLSSCVYIIFCRKLSGYYNKEDRR